jgi:hypothetical protein
VVEEQPHHEQPKKHADGTIPRDRERGLKFEFRQGDQAERDR